jgi:hypothetical protein
MKTPSLWTNVFGGPKARTYSPLFLSALLIECPVRVSDVGVTRIRAVAFLASGMLGRIFDVLLRSMSYSSVFVLAARCNPGLHWRCSPVPCFFLIFSTRTKEMSHRENSRSRLVSPAVSHEISKNGKSNRTLDLPFYELAYFLSFLFRFSSSYSISRSILMLFVRVSSLLTKL